MHTGSTMDGTDLDGKTSDFERTTGRFGGQDPHIWSSPEGGHKIDIGKQIFCNRSLNMKNMLLSDLTWITLWHNTSPRLLNLWLMEAQSES